VRSSTGEHYVALDHLRALAAFLVFNWHFLHVASPTYDYSPLLFPLALINQGHVGVALFMALSGYLFAKLLHGKQIDYFAFLRARFMRLAPLLVVVVFTAGFVFYGATSVHNFGVMIAKGLFLPTWPNGGWSITVEMHFYILLPLLLWLASKDIGWLAVSVVAAMGFRLWLFLYQGAIRDDAYFTLIGRIDQFVLGIMAFHWRRWAAGAHKTAAATFVAFAAFYWWFDMWGGFKTGPRPDLWIIMPTVEGVSWALLIAYYDNTFRPRNTGVSKFIALIGTYSYSIYLLHPFLVKKASLFVDQHIMGLTSIYAGLIWSTVGFLCMVPFGYLSFRFIESPFLRNRVRYVKAPAAKPSREFSRNREPSRPFPSGW